MHDVLGNRACKQSSSYARGQRKACFYSCLRQAEVIFWFGPCARHQDILKSNICTFVNSLQIYLQELNEDPDLRAASIKASFEDCVLSLGAGAGSMQAVLYTSPWRGACIEKGTLEIKSLDVARDVMKATRHSSLMLVRAPGGRGFHVSGCW